MVYKEREEESEGKICKALKDGCHETHAASSPADCAHAHEDGEGRTTDSDCAGMRNGTFGRFGIGLTNGEDLKV